MIMEGRLFKNFESKYMEIEKNNADHRALATANHCY